MAQLKKQTFICLDCETTGLDVKKDRILEVAVARFTFGGIEDSFESLVNPKHPISEESITIHHITAAMVENQPPIEELLPRILALIGTDPIMGHGIAFDVDLLINAAKRAGIPCTLQQNTLIDTLRLARHYGDSPNNSLERLAQHFNVPIVISHRAMHDVTVNIEVFKHLTRRYERTEEILAILSRPIKMRFMPLGKHKGRPFGDIPLQYLLWAARMDFDQDLLYSIDLELKKRRLQEHTFKDNPFAEL